MAEIIRTIIVMSVSGSIIALLLFAIKPLIKNRLPKSAQYYLWLIVVTALLLPVSRFVSVPQYREHVPTAPIHSVVERNVISTAEQNERATEIQRQNPNLTDLTSQQSPISGVVDIVSYIYPIGVGVVLLYRLLAYALFIRKMRLDCVRVDIPCKISVYRSSKTATPMLVGLFRPKIILPECEYSDAQIHVILLHELTHLRRKDVIVKWLSCLSCAVHWFNPIVWLVSREIDRACEFSCDEAVIAKLDANGRQIYGDTLIYVAADHKLRTALAMSESGRNLKERLGAIMKSKKRTRGAVFISAVMLVVVASAAIVLGAGSSDKTPTEFPHIPPLQYSYTEEDTIGTASLDDIADDGCSCGCGYRPLGTGSSDKTPTNLPNISPPQYSYSEEGTICRASLDDILLRLGELRFTHKDYAVNVVVNEEIRSEGLDGVDTI
ncbi:MAG: hypothetical protein LBL82_06500 [Oscillospiraceae bacterium]|jgi:beta-lactamase regulating signal transducer with metallopeptidase domain|nr:hypothetical protein [Oscillospiraceae bacterium]